MFIRSLRWYIYVTLESVWSLHMVVLGRRLVVANLVRNNDFVEMV